MARPAGQQVVGPAKEGILFMKERRNACQARRQKRREGRVAAETDHRRRAAPKHQDERLREAETEFQKRQCAARKPALERRGGGKHGAAGRRDQARAAAVGHQQRVDPGAAKCLGHGEGREHMAAGAARGQRDQGFARGAHHTAS